MTARRTAQTHRPITARLHRDQVGRLDHAGLAEDGQLRAGDFVAQHIGMPRKPKSQALSMIDQVGEALARAENGNFATDAARYRRLALAALKPLTRPTEAMVDAAQRRCGSTPSGPSTIIATSPEPSVQ